MGNLLTSDKAEVILLFTYELYLGKESLLNGKK